MCSSQVSFESDESNESFLSYLEKKKTASFIVDGCKDEAGTSGLSPNRINSEIPTFTESWLKCFKPKKRNENVKKKSIQNLTQKEGTENHFGEPKPNSMLQLMREDSVLQSLEDLSTQLKLKQQEVLDSFANCYSVSRKEIGIVTDAFNANQRVQNYVDTIDRPPPPYLPPPAYSQSTAPPDYYLEIEPTREIFAFQSREYGSLLNQMDDDVVDRFSQLYTGAFNFRKSRNKFLSRIYILICFQFFTAFMFILLCKLVGSVAYFMQNQMGFLVVASLIEIWLLGTLYFSIDIRRQYPFNWGALIILYFCTTYLLAATACLTQIDPFLYSIATITFLCGSISIIAQFNLADVAHWSFGLTILALIVAPFGIIGIILTKTLNEINTIRAITAFLIVFFFMVYMVFDTQKIISGSRVPIRSHQYVFGTICLYVDFITIIYSTLCFKCIRNEE